MKKIAMCIAMAAVVAACGKQEAPESQASPSTAPSQAAQAPLERAPTPGHPVPASEGERGMDALAAAGVKFDFPHQVLYDIIDVNGSGKRRHRVLVEIRSGEFKQVAGQFGQSLEALGYAKESGKDTSGRIDSVYTAAGKPTYYLIMQPAGMGPKLGEPDSTGSIHIMWDFASRS